MNALGLAGPEAAREPAPGTLRVVCLGDSCTFGFGAGPGNAYPRLLEERFGRAFGSGRVEVLNAGVPSYTSTQSLRQFRRDLLALRPAIAVAYLGANNDFVPAAATDEAAIARLSRPLARVLAASNAARWLRTLGSRAPEAGTAGATTFRTPLPEFRENLRDLARSCRDAGVALLLVVPPFSPERRAADPRCLEYGRAVAEVASAEGVSAVDPSADFEALDPYPLWAEPIHPSKHGHRLLADLLYDALVTEPALALAFEGARADLAALRAFEAFAVRADRETIGEGEREAVLQILDGPGVRGSPVERARAILRGGGPSAPGFEDDPLSRALLAWEEGDLGRACALLVEARARHPYRPGIGELASRLGCAGAFDPPSHAAWTDALHAKLRSLPSGEALAPARIAAEASLLLHRDRVLGSAGFDPHVAFGIRDLREGRIDDARAAFEKALETNPAEPVALAHLAALRHLDGDPSRAEDLFRRAVREDPDDTESWVRLAELARERHDLDEAIRCLDAGLAVRPRHLRALGLRARLRLDRGDRAEATQDLRTALELLPDDPGLLDLLAEAEGSSRQGR